MTPERKARVGIDALLVAAGTHVCDMAEANVHAAIDVAIRELPLDGGVGFVENLFHVNGWACGLIETNKQGPMSEGVELQSGRHVHAVADGVSVVELEKQFSRFHETVANLKRHRASGLKSAVEGRLVETEPNLARCVGRTYEAGEQLLQRIFKELRTKWARRDKWKEPAAPTADAPSPDGWVWASVDQLTGVETGATLKRDKAVYWNDGDVPWVTSCVVNDGYLDDASEFAITSALAETNLTLYPIGILLIDMYGEGTIRGKCTELRTPVVSNQALVALQVDAFIRGYLRHFLELNYEEMCKVVSVGVQPNLNLSLVRAACVPLPPLSEQVRIVAEADRHLTTIREVEVDANFQRVQALRQATLSKAFADR